MKSILYTLVFLFISASATAQTVVDVIVNSVNFKKKKFLITSILVCICICFTSCNKDSLTDNLQSDNLESVDNLEELEPNDLRTYTEEEVNQIIENFTGSSSDKMTVQEKMLVLVDIRKAEYDIPIDSRNTSYNVFAASVVKLTNGDLIFADDGDFSPTFPTTTISANANQFIDAPVNASQLWSFAVVEVDGVAVRTKSFNTFDYSCTNESGEKRELRLRSSATVYSWGGITAFAYEVCTEK